MQTTQSMARVVEVQPEIGQVTSSYVHEEVSSIGERRELEWPWVLWERRKFVCKVTICGFILTTILAVLIPNRYESTTSLMPPDTQSGSGIAIMAALATKGGGLGPLAEDLLGMKSSGALFIEIVGSRTVQDRLIERFNLRRVYHDKYWQDARHHLSAHTTASEDRKSGVITITVSDHDPHRAAQMAQAYVEELDRLVAEVSTSSARRERVFIEQRLQTVKQDLDKASKQFSEYASQNTAIDITAQAKASVDAAAKLEGELIAAQSELEGLEQVYTKNNVRVRSMQARVDELRTQLHNMGGDSSDLGDKLGSEQEFPSIRQLPLLGVKWADLYRQTKIQETVYELLTQQYELAKIEEAKEIPVVKVLDVAVVPEKKSGPPRLLVGFIGSLLFLLAAITWIVGSVLWRQADPEGCWKHIGIEVMADLRVLNQRLRTRRKGARHQIQN
jgi:capsule polysaccharide export protein KpsE/RkpR